MEADAHGGLLLDRLVPRHDVGRIDLVVAAAPPATAYRALREIDLLQVHTPLLDASMWVRGLPARLRGDAVELDAGVTMRLADLFDPGREPTGEPAIDSWLPLGDEPDRALTFGVVGRFWTPTILWQPIEPADFAAFAAPGRGRIGATLAVLPYGARRSVLVYDVRAEAVEVADQRRLRRYWRVVEPFVGVVLRAVLEDAARQAEAWAGHPTVRAAP
jgi:hypothetical protein